MRYYEMKKISKKIKKYRLCLVDWRTIDTFVYNALMNQNNPGMSAAAGFFQSVVGCVLVVTANALIRRISREDALF